MKKKILIGSSSFLLPNNSSWNILENKYNLGFADYGGYNEIFGNKNVNKIVCFHLFFEDLNNSKNIKEKLNFILKLVEQRLKISQEPLIFGYSNRDDFEIIKNAKLRNEELPSYQKFFLKIEKFKKLYSNFYELNLNKEFSKIGFNHVYDERNWYILRCRLSIEGIKIVSNSFHKIIERIYNPASKLLVLDCDNTLWGGVVGEDGVKNIIIGQDGIGKAYYDFQKKIKQIADEGTLLAICSKNNEEDVWDAFNKNKNMILKKNDFIAHRINWKNKADNIQEISKELNIGLKSFVFWDDNPMERSIVKKYKPSVKVIPVDEDICQWPKILNENFNFQKFRVTKEDINKKKQYIIRSNFEKQKSVAFNEKKYLKSINLKPSLHKINNSNILRAEQLCQKTNQFNLRNIRYTVSDIEKINKDSNCKIFLIGLSDVFGNHGLVGLIIIRKVSFDTCIIDNMMLSCRVFGRNLESWILKKVIDMSKKDKIKYVIAEYVKTKKNKIALDFLKANNFKVLKSKSKKLNISKKRFNYQSTYLFDIIKDEVPNLELFK
jgi:FkbH-like protein